MEVRVEDGVAVKRVSADDPLAAERLRHECSVLERLTHPGLVQVVAFVDHPDGETELHTLAVGGPALTSLVGGDAATTARTIAALATTVADLHELGVAHTRLTADHVLLDEAGRPIICSLGDAVAATPSDHQAAGDVAALGCLLDGLVRTDAADPLASLRSSRASRRRDEGLAGSLERLIRQATSHDWEDRPTARVLADALWSAVDQASTEPEPQKRSTRWSPTTARRAIPAAVGVAALLGWYAVAAARPARRAAPTGSSRSASAEVPVDGARATNSNVVTIDGHRYAVGRPGDQVLVGRFDCAHTTAAVLTPQGGLFVFDHLADKGVDVTARHLRDVDPSATIKTSDEDGDGCDELVVQSAGSAAITISAREAS